MRSFHILDVKKFMSMLLLQTVFDDFLFREMEILTNHRTVLSGRRNENWYSKEEIEELSAMGIKEYLPWSEVKGQAKDAVKGKQSPELLKGVLYLPKGKMEELATQSGMRSDQVQALAWNLHFDKNELYIITAVSLTVFIMDKTLEQSWDAYTEEILKKLEIFYE